MGHLNLGTGPENKALYLSTFIKKVSGSLLEHWFLQIHKSAAKNMNLVMVLPGIKTSCKCAGIVQWFHASGSQNCKRDKALVLMEEHKGNLTETSLCPFLTEEKKWWLCDPI